MSSCHSVPIEPISHSPGIYFDPATVAYFYNDYWNVITHVELINIKPYLKKIENTIQSISNFCEKVQNLAIVNIDCKDIINPLEILITANNLKYDSLYHLVSVNSPDRFKRALEFGGEILKFFFGTLDADDARKYDDAISACQQDESQIYSLMKDNIQVVQSTINNFNVSIQKLNNNEVRLNKQIEKLNSILSENSKLHSKLLNTEKINSIFNIIEGSLLSVSNILDTILNSILFAKVNVLHPYVLTPTKLYEELSNSVQSKRYTEFPISLSLQNIHTIIDLSKLTSYYYNNKLVFVIQIPLINPIKFDVYKILPLPTPQELKHYQTYVLIQSPKLYIAVTDDRLSYALLDSISECNIVNKDYKICPMPSVLSTINNPTCETKLLTEVNLALPDVCDSKVIYGNIDLWQKLNNGKHIYVQSKPNKLTMKCSNEITDYTLQGTGILTIDEDCIAYFQTLQFYPSHVSNTVLPSQINVKFNITEDDCCKFNVINETSHVLTPITLANINLESLKLASHKLDQLQNQIDQNQNQSHIVKYGHYYSAMTYVIILIFAIYLIYKIYKKCFCNDSASCCIQIFNQCYNKKLSRRDNKVHTSIELTEISDDASSECDKKSIKSLPEIEINKNRVNYRHSKTLDRNLNNF